MSGPKELRAQQRLAWLVLIGQRLKQEYDAMAKPLPAPLALLLQRLEARTTEGDPIGTARQDNRRAAGNGGGTAGASESRHHIDSR